MKPHLDTAACQGHGRCYHLAPQLFDCDDEGYAILKTTGDLTPDDEQPARLAAASCPEHAITID